MGYDLHIERFSPDTGEPEEIPVETWIAAAAATENVRVYVGERHSVTNPHSGEVISWLARPGDLEVRFGTEWRFVFRWFAGKAKFRSYPVEVGDLSDPVWAAAVALARRVGAAIRGDEGERYDLDTGEIIRA